MSCRRVLGTALFVIALTSALYWAHPAFAQGIGQVRVVASAQKYTGPCPAHLRFTAKIEVEKYPMVVNYQWQRSDGAKGPEHMVRVRSAAQKIVTAVESWEIGTRGERIEVWEKIRVRSGNADIASDAATVTVACR